MNRFSGLMTIGKEGDLNAFKELRELRTKVCKELALNEKDVELSMGMSADYLDAVFDE